MSQKKEISIDNYEQETPIWQHQVVTELEALSQAPPFADPEHSVQSDLPLREFIAEAVERLEPRKRYVVEATMFGERMSFRRLGVQMNLSKSQVFRIYEDALEDLYFFLTVYAGES